MINFIYTQYWYCHLCFEYWIHDCFSQPLMTFLMSILSWKFFCHLLCSVSFYQTQILITITQYVLNVYYTSALNRAEALSDDAV